MVFISKSFTLTLKALNLVINMQEAARSCAGGVSFLAVVAGWCSFVCCCCGAVFLLAVAAVVGCFYLGPPAAVRWCGRGVSFLCCYCGAVYFLLFGPPPAVHSRAGLLSLQLVPEGGGCFFVCFCCGCFLLLPLRVCKCVCMCVICSCCWFCWRRGAWLFAVAAGGVFVFLLLLVGGCLVFLGGRLFCCCFRGYCFCAVWAPTGSSPTCWFVVASAAEQNNKKAATAKQQQNPSLPRLVQKGVS